MTKDAQGRSAIPFSFANYADDFDDHIEKSIRGYAHLREDCVLLSEYFVENDTNVLDLGCSTGRFLRRIRDHNQGKAPHASYIGVDIEPEFSQHWRGLEQGNIKYQLGDLRSLNDIDNH